MKLKTTAALLAALCLAAALVSGCAGGGNVSVKEYDSSINYYYADEEGMTRFIVDSTLLEDAISGYVDSFLSCDGSVGIARAGTGLYRVSAEGLLKIYPAGVERALLSLDNNVIVFTTATELHIYDHRTGKLEDIRPEGASGIPTICVSPDSSTVGYTVKTSDGCFAYAYENGASRLLANGANIAAIAEGAERFYYMEPDSGDLHCVSGGSDRRIGTGVTGVLEFNRDLTEALFDMNGVTYYSVRGSAAKALVAGASLYPTNAECESTQGGADISVSVKDTDSLFGGVFFRVRTSSADPDARAAYDLWYVDGAKRVTELVRGAYQFFVIENRTRVACLVDGDVYKLDPKSPSDRTLISSNTYNFNVSEDGKSFYLVGYDMGLYYAEPGRLPAQIDTNVIHSQLTTGGVCLYLKDYDLGGSLRAVRGLTEPVDITGGVAQIELAPKAAFYYTSIYEDELGNRVYDVYVSADGFGFEKAVACAAVTAGN